MPSSGGEVVNMHDEGDVQPSQLGTHLQVMEARPRTRQFRTRSTNLQQAECCLYILTPQAALWNPVQQRRCLRDWSGSLGRRRIGRKTEEAHLVGSRVRSKYFVRRRRHTLRCPAT